MPPLSLPLVAAAASAPTQGAFANLALLAAMGFIKAVSLSDSGSAATDTAPAPASDSADAADASDVNGGQRLPVKGGATSAQSPAKASLPAGADAASVGRHLLDDSAIALAHQKLLQIASLPQEAAAAKSQGTHWMFEVPLATPNGTAVAQFAIDKDSGQDTQGEDKETVWRARFSVDIEPLGPVHASIALGGEKTWVTLWADRRDSLQALKDGAGALTTALNAAELNAEVAFRPVLTPKPVVIGSGHFLDRLS